MSKYEQDIRNAVSLRGSIGVGELAELLNVSDQTIRRIVKPLVDRGEVEKVHGAIVSTKSIADPPFLARMNRQKAAKIAIAARIAQLVQPGDSIAIDTGSTSAFVAQALRQHHDLTVVTNAAFIASTLAMMPGNRVYMAGSELRDHDGAAFDKAAFDTIGSHHTDWAVLSASSVHPRRGFLVQEQCEVDMCGAMMQISDNRIWAVDASKFTDKHLALALPAAMRGDLLITTASPGAAYDSMLAQLDIQMVVDY
ncbi:MAG: DeoR/GlpR family DNA-binding transcription regulator [Hyphomicrobiales bacterium]